MSQGAPLILVRALHFWAVATLFGGAGFLLVLGRRPPKAAYLLRVAAVIAAATGAGWFALVFAAVAGSTSALGDPDAWADFAGAPFGPPWLVRLALCGAALAAVLARRPVPFVLIGAALVVNQAWLGHAASGPSLGLVFYWLHVGAGFAWVGALVMLCVTTLAERGVPRDGVAIFAWLGVPVVVSLVGGGLAEAALRGVTPADVAATTYGRIVAAKIGLLAAMLALALYHRVRARRATAAMPLTLPIETALGLIVLALAATLGVTPPPG